MYHIALRMLFGDRTKYLMLVSSLAFATLLMTQQSGVFSGLMIWTTATLQNTGVPVWVMDPMVEQVNEVKPLRDTDLARVRSVDGVAWAVPYMFALQQVKMYDGRFKTAKITGLDSQTLIGAPGTILKGSLDELWQADAVMVDEEGIKKLSEGRARPLDIGGIFEINDHEVRIVAICRSAKSFFGYPNIYTTYEHAIEIIPKQRKNLSFILVQQRPEITPKELVARIEKETGLKAITDNDFFWSTIWWYVKNTGIPFSFGITILLGFLVGVVVCAQTFYTFILENMGSLGAIKAMGATNGLLYRMLLTQALFVGFVGYGIGMLIASLFGLMALKKGQPPFFLPPTIVGGVFVCVIGICIFAAYLGIRRIAKLEPAEVFRA